MRLIKPRWPNLYYDHPGFFVVAAGLLLTHAVLGLDAVIPRRHANAIWSYVNSFIGHQFWLLGALHWLITALILFGLYAAGRQFRFARIGFLASLIFFNVLGVGMFIAGLNNSSVSFYGAVASVSLSMSSFAAYREPTFNPLLARPRRGR